MKRHLAILIAALASLTLAFGAYAGQAEATVQPLVPVSAQERCSPPGHQPMTLAQVSQADCCKGHKGVCGCRAGKIICCDNTVSPNCTCHADSIMEN